MIPRIIIFAIAALLLAAHFLRQGNIVMTALCALMPLLFICRKRWSLIALQILAYLAAGLWIVTAIFLVQERLALGKPWTAAVVILGTVAAFTVAAGLLLNSAVIREKYP